MLCPVCGNEMESGIITAADGMRFPMSWLPKEVYLKKAFMPVTKKGIQKLGGEIISVSQEAMLPHVNAFICKKCRKIIIDY